MNTTTKIKSMDKSVGIKSVYLATNNLINRFLDAITPVADFIARYWIAKVFFFNALAKFSGWKSTVMLFTYEHELPALLDNTPAGSMTWLTFIFCILLFLGAWGRLPALFLFIINLITVASLPILFTDIGRPILSLHVLWGLILLLLMVHGPGKLSLDFLICNKKHREIV